MCSDQPRAWTGWRTASLRAVGLVRALRVASLLLVLAVGVMVTPARASRDRDPGGAARLMVQFRDLAGELSSPAGESLRGVFAEMGLFSRTAESWRSLGGALGLTPEGAIDALLGGRFLMLANEVGGDPEGWACVMSVDADLGRRLPRLLDAAPRGSVGGRTAYAIEDGRLFVVPIAGGRRMVVSTPGADRLQRSAIRLAETWEAGDEAEAGQTQSGGLVIYRPTPGSWISATVERVEDDERKVLGAAVEPPLASQQRATSVVGGWDVRFVAVGAAPDENLQNGVRSERPVARIDANWFHAVSADAGIAYAGPIERERGKHASGVRLPIEAGPLGDDVGNLRRWAGAFMPFASPPELIDGGADCGVFVAGPSRAGSVWLRVADARSAAKIGDAYVCDLVGILAGAAAIEPEGPECTGVFPTAARRVALGDGADTQGSSQEDETERDPFADLGFAWGAATVSPSVPSRDGRREVQAWWSMHSVPTGTRAPALRPGIAEDDESPAVRFLVRPDLLIDRVGESGGLAGMVKAAAMGGMSLESLRRITLLDFSLAPDADDESRSEGLLRVRFGADAG